jgi:hypothetical protein
LVAGFPVHASSVFERKQRSTSERSRRNLPLAACMRVIGAAGHCGRLLTFAATTTTTTTTDATADRRQLECGRSLCLRGRRGGGWQRWWRSGRRRLQDAPVVDVADARKKVIGCRIVYRLGSEIASDASCRGCSKIVMNVMVEVVRARRRGRRG